MDLGQHIPSARHIISTSNLRNKKTFQNGIIDLHPFNIQMEVFFPSNADNIRESFRFLQYSDFFYYRVSIDIANLLEPEFLHKYVQKEGFCALALNSPIDRCNSVAILPTNKMLLSIDAKTYEELGLVGEDAEKFAPRNFKCESGKSRRFLITIDLCSRSFVERNSYYEKVVSCLKDKFLPTEMVVWLVEDGAPQLIDFPLDSNGDQPDVQRCELSGKLDELSDISIPLINEYVQNLDHSSDRSDILEDIYEWLGALSCGCVDLLKRTDAEPFIRSFNTPSTMIYQELSSGTKIRWRGVIPNYLIKNVLHALHKTVEEKSCSWASMTIWGFSDSIVSWLPSSRTSKEPSRSFFIEGSNGYTFVVFPNGNYILYQNLGPHDEAIKS